jgi:hypothetical protein
MNHSYSKRYMAEGNMGRWLLAGGRRNALHLQFNGEGSALR